MQGIDTVGDQVSTACVGAPERCETALNKVNTRLEDLQHHRWVLAKINGQALSDYAQQGFVEGNAGCILCTPNHW
jgi:hypothetical protein